LAAVFDLAGCEDLAAVRLDDERLAVFEELEDAFPGDFVRPVVVPRLALGSARSSLACCGACPERFFRDVATLFVLAAAAPAATVFLAAFFFLCGGAGLRPLEEDAVDSASPLPSSGPPLPLGRSITARTAHG
jgi:hypothetical protein